MSLEAAGAIASGVSSIAQPIVQATQGKKQRRWATKEAEKAYQRNLASWHMQNQYNSPEEQMARLKAAGLNPNLVYGKGAQQSAAQKIGEYQAARGDYPQISLPNPLSEINQYQDTQIKRQELENMETIGDTLLSESLMKAAEAMAKTGLSDHKYAKYLSTEYYHEYMKYQLSSMKERARKTSLDASMTSMDLDNYWINKLGIPLGKSALQGVAGMFKLGKSIKYKPIKNPYQKYSR